MDRLPVELVARICSLLCPHCEAPDSFMFTLSDAEWETGNVSLETGHASLARFSKTSRRIAAIAQPYLFHYFATGRQIRFIEDGTIAISGLPNENHRLALFLRTVIQRPELAVRVKALRLAPLPAVHGREYDNNHRTATPVEVLRQARSKLGDVVDNALFFPGFSWDLHRKKFTDSAIYHGLEQLAIVLCPNADTVVLGDEQPSSRPWNVFVSRKWTFPSLKRAELLLYKPSRLFTLARHVFDSAPNIETLRVAHLTRPRRLTMDTNWGTSWTMTLPSVRRLVGSDISVTDLAALVKSCPQLRDHEYKHHSRALTCRVRGRELLEALQPARKTLHRLLLVITATSDPRGDMMPGASVGTLKDFDALEELVVNQNQVAGGFVVVGQAAPSTDLTRFLPRSIKNVVFLNIWCNFNPDLEGLLQDAPVELPNLRSLRFNHLSVRQTRMLATGFRPTRTSTTTNASESRLKPSPFRSIGAGFRRGHRGRRGRLEDGFAPLGLDNAISPIYPSSPRGLQRTCSLSAPPRSQAAPREKPLFLGRYSTLMRSYIENGIRRARQDPVRVPGASPLAISI